MTKALWCCRETFDGFKRWLFRAESVVFQLQQSGAKGKRELYLWPVRARHPLCFASSYGSMSRVKVPDEASGEVEENDKQWEFGDAPASFKSGMLNHFGFPVSRHEEGENVTDRKKTMWKHCWTRTDAHLWHLSAHTETVKVYRCLIKSDCTLSKFLSLKSKQKKITIHIIP